MTIQATSTDAIVTVKFGLVAKVKIPAAIL
jgi:hypothetical protein